MGHLPTTRRPLLLPLALPATEPAWLCVRRKTRRIRRSSDILKRCHRFTDLPEVPAVSSDGPGVTSQPNFMSVITAMDALHEEMLVKLHENNSLTDCSSVDLSVMASMRLPLRRSSH